ncbi:MAG TPA: EAL domain-containing protein [Rubrivivax sp.]|nr:EAL domain-containing protein [Rubrivivax sp.]
MIPAPATALVDPKLRRLINVAALLTGLLLTVAVPAAYLSARVAQERGKAITLTAVYGSLVTAAIAQKPTLWQYEEHKLLALVEHNITRDDGRTSYAITDAQRQPLASSAKVPPAAPTLVEETALYDATDVVGYYRVERSLRPALRDTAVVAMLALVTALLCGLQLRALPLRALRRSQERLLHMAKHDALTGLPNRSLLDDRLEQALLHAERYGRHVTVAFMDLDDFKSINDSLGHDVGDELLIQMSCRLTHTVRSTDTVVRLGGDEFVILMFDQPNVEESMAAALRRLMEAVSEPMDLGGHKVQLGCSIGVATYPMDGKDGSTLLKNADTAMYRAKEVGKSNFQFYTADLNAKLKERMALQDGLLQAMGRDEFYLEYQPQIDSASGRVIGVETLVRWNSPELGVVPPTKFIPLAEDSGIIVALGLWVLRTACLQQVAWHNDGLQAIKMSVNVSPRQFKEPSFAESVATVLKESGIQPELLELEITESLIMEDVPRAVAMMNRLRALGVQLSIDDFGTGYSSLSSLKNFPVSRLKIDRSFVNMLPGNSEDCVLAKAVIALGHQLNLKVVAEGVETQQQQDFLEASDCDEMQGYHFSRPVSAKAVHTMLTQASALPPIRAPADPEKQEVLQKTTTC